VLRAFVPSEEDHRRRTAASRLAARSFVASIKGARQTAARRLVRSFVASVREPARLQHEAGKKSTADSTSSHTMEMKLWYCRCLASHVATDGATRVTVAAGDGKFRDAGEINARSGCTREPASFMLAGG
jgi:hypothetical protein